MSQKSAYVFWCWTLGRAKTDDYHYHYHHSVIPSTFDTIQTKSPNQSYKKNGKLGSLKSTLELPSGKLTWLAGRWTSWRCIPYWKWWFSIAMLVYWRVHHPLFLATRSSTMIFWFPSDLTGQGSGSAPNSRRHMRWYQLLGRCGPDLLDTLRPRRSRFL